MQGKLNKDKQTVVFLLQMFPVYLCTYMSLQYRITRVLTANQQRNGIDNTQLSTRRHVCATNDDITKNIPSSFGDNTATYMEIFSTTSVTSSTSTHQQGTIQKITK